MLSWFMDIKIILCYAIMDGQDILQSMYPEYGELDMQLEQIHEIDTVNSITSLEKALQVWINLQTKEMFPLMR